MSVMSSDVIVLDESDAAALADGAKIVAFRWDLIPWSLVIDIDYKVSHREGGNSVGRAWLILELITDISVTLTESRLPTGVFSNDVIRVYDADHPLKSYELSLIAPTFDREEKIQGDVNRKLKLVAEKLSGIKSNRIGSFGQFGPSYDERQDLISDRHLLAVATQDKNC
jgi:hypothetical protein